MTADLAKVTTPSGYSLPPFPRHALTTHLPTWEALLGFVDRKPEVMSRIKSMYPRMMLHRDVVELASHIARFAKVGDDQTCVPYPSLEAAEHQIAFCTDPRRGEAMLNTENLNLRAFDIDIRYYAVFFAAENADKVMPFWTNAGVGASSRMAEQSMQHIDQMKEVALPEPSPAAYLEDHQIETPATLKVKERIASLMERAPVGGPRDDNIKVKPDDIYLYPSGMAGIWWVHEYLIGARSGTTVLYGFAFHCTYSYLAYMSRLSPIAVRNGGVSQFLSP